MSGGDLQHMVALAHIAGSHVAVDAPAGGPHFDITGAPLVLGCQRAARVTVRAGADRPAHLRVAWSGSWSDCTGIRSIPYLTVGLRLTAYDRFHPYDTRDGSHAPAAPTPQPAAVPARIAA